MNVEEASERLEKATFGATRRAALTALVGGALLLGVAPEGEAAKKAKTPQSAPAPGALEPPSPGSDH